MVKKLDGKDIGNAHLGIRITVTKRDIANGTRLAEDSCAAAQCCVRSIQGATEAKVHRGVVYLKINGNWRRYRTSSALRMETIIFDRGGKFIPGEYDLLPVSVSSLERAARGKSKPRPSAPVRSYRKPIRRTFIPGTRVTANGYSED